MLPAVQCALRAARRRGAVEKGLTMETVEPQPMTPRSQYWRSTLGVTSVLLAIWFVVTFVVSFYARDLNFHFFGWPFSFWMAAQGAPLVYCLIVWFYAWYMRRLDIRHAMAEFEE
jgi:putative solute:sodium symporter small subunit